MRTRKANLHERTIRDTLSGKNTAAYFDPLGEAKAPPFCCPATFFLMNGNSGHITPIIPGSLNQKADATPSDAYMPATNGSLRQNASDVKQKTVLTKEEGAQAPTNPRGRLENQAVVHGDAKAPSVNSILQKVLDVKQGKGHGQHSPFWWA